MKVLVPEALISEDRHTLTFVLNWRGQIVTCFVPRKCLEVFFGYRPMHARAVRVFGDGFARIEAVAQRKLLAHPTPSMQLTHADVSNC